ncbi:mannosyl-oligosaccharide alpha-1,2-mannosidase IA-like [Armigeres subalbatus]|uniref:mannosyl-oligosaccharide alpha-1,2-mannosidase IA-like n=1 Tax=Armigeres subalbatus TaxID=124917 RepID=UPI002ED3C2A7
MLPTYQRIGGTSQPSNPLLSVRRSFRSSEKCLILLVLLTFGFVCFGGFFFLPDNFGADRVLKVYKQFQRAGPEIFIPPPPPAHGMDGDEDLHKQNDREKLQEKIQKELPDDFLEKPDLDEGRTGGPEFDNALDSGVPAGDAPGPVAGGPEGVVAPPQILEEPDLKGGASSSSRGSTAGSGAFQTFNTSVGEDVDPAVREKRNKVKELNKMCMKFA